MNKAERMMVVELMRMVAHTAQGLSLLSETCSDDIIKKSVSRSVDQVLQGMAELTAQIQKEWLDE